MDIFKALVDGDRAMTLGDIARSAKVNDEVLVQRIVQALAAHGMVDQLDAQHYKANDITKDFATPGRHGGVMTQMFSMRAYSALPQVLRKNGYKSPPDLKSCCWQEAYGSEQTMWEWMKENPEMGKYFNDYMSAARPHTGLDLADEYPFQDLFQGSKAEDVAFVDV